MLDIQQLQKISEANIKPPPSKDGKLELPQSLLHLVYEKLQNAANQGKRTLNLNHWHNYSKQCIPLLKSVLTANGFIVSHPKMPWYKKRVDRSKLKISW
jgi:hypothetical protein